MMLSMRSGRKAINSRFLTGKCDAAGDSVTLKHIVTSNVAACESDHKKNALTEAYASLVTVMQQKADFSNFATTCSRSKVVIIPIAERKSTEIEATIPAMEETDMVVVGVQHPSLIHGLDGPNLHALILQPHDNLDLHAKSVFLDYDHHNNHPQPLRPIPSPPSRTTAGHFPSLTTLSPSHLNLTSAKPPLELLALKSRIPHSSVAGHNPTASHSVSSHVGRLISLGLHY
ncbi:unnamed protein product [Sphenostylis stenocarpa]|uniref:Uncharacterized protein n=1 Tax=Sphenostylis stenocarpa TaxID=92480 RepID=A0AA86W137_9FABA|nr:unnamed protein product [Sphenostylis stenocarpa]